MSRMAQTGRTWLARYYDKVILVVALLLLLASVGWLMMRIGRETQLMAVSGAAHTPSPDQIAGPADLTAADEVLARIERPVQAPAVSNWAFGSALRVACVSCAKPIGYPAMVCPFCGAAQPEPADPRKVDSDGDGLPDWWENEQGLNPLDPGDAQVDGDADGFTALEEFRAGTLPADAASVPARVSKLRYERIVRQPFNLRFLAVNQLTETEVRYQLNLRSMDRTYFAGMGDVVEGYKVADYQKLADGREILTLEQGARRVRLEKGKVYSDEQLLIVLKSLIDGEIVRTRLNGSFKLRDEEYVVRGADAEGVQVEAVAGGKITLVPRLSPLEAAVLRGEAPVTGDEMLPGPDALMMAPR